MKLKKIECIGDGGTRARPYGVWEIRGLDDAELFQRWPVPAQKSYADANGAGTRGVFAYYLLRPERIYEIIEPLSWSRGDHYFVYLDDGQEVRGTMEDAFRWISATSG